MRIIAARCGVTLAALEQANPLRFRLTRTTDRAFPGQMSVFGFAMNTGRYTAVGPKGLTDYAALPAPNGSFERVFHDLGPRFVLDLRPARTVSDARWLGEQHDFRSVGAMATDAQFYPLALASAFDAVIYFDSTTPARQVPRAAAVRTDTLPDRLPPGWKQGSPMQPQMYRVSLDSLVHHGGRTSARLATRMTSPAGMGAVVQKLKADAYAGKRVRFSAWLRTTGASGGAGLHIRAAGSDRALDEAESTPISAARDWTLQQVVLDVPAGADELFVRCWLAGSGELWMDDAALEVVGPEVPAMNSHQPKPYNTSPEVKAWWGALPDHLVNPGLEPEASATAAN